jgi:hypothetical protein
MYTSVYVHIQTLRTLKKDPAFWDFLHFFWEKTRKAKKDMMIRLVSDLIKDYYAYIYVSVLSQYVGS